MEQKSIPDLGLQRDCGSLDAVPSEQSSLPRICAHSMGKSKHGTQNGYDSLSKESHYSVISGGSETL